MFTVPSYVVSALFSPVAFVLLNVRITSVLGYIYQLSHVPLLQVNMHRPIIPSLSTQTQKRRIFERYGAVSTATTGGRREAFVVSAVFEMQVHQGRLLPLLLQDFAVALKTRGSCRVVV